MLQKHTRVQAELYTAQNRRRRIWYQIVGVLALVVALGVSYMLILPAITAANNEMTQDEGYISELKMGTRRDDAANPDGITDGSANWDDNDTEDGCDSNDANLRVRTFDRVKYDFWYQTQPYDTGLQNLDYNSVRVYFEFLLPATAEQAYFSVDEMVWLRDTKSAYEITTATIDETYYQVLRGSFMDNRGDEGAITAATNSKTAVVRVLNMSNGAILQPVFTMWLEPNDVGTTLKNNIPSQIVYGFDYSCGTHHRQEYATVIPKPVIVTCAPHYSVTMKCGESSSTAYVGDFDYAAGNDLALDKDSGTWTGRMSAYGIRLAVQGDSNKGLRGCSFPQAKGTIEFDLYIKTSYADLTDTTKTYHNITDSFTARVWSADAFLGTDGQQDGRPLRGNQQPSYAAPLNKSDQEYERSYSCKDGGTWTFSGNTSDIEQVDGESCRKVHVKVSGYSFDVNHLPSADERSGGKEYYDPDVIGKEYWNIETAVFSSGEIWLTVPFYKAAGTDTSNYILNVTGMQEIAMKLDIAAYNMAVKDESNSTIYSGAGKLAESGANVSLIDKGGFFSRVSLLSPLTDYKTPLSMGCFNPEEGDEALQDYATPGSYVDLESYFWNDDAEGNEAGAAYNLVLKFDNACFEPVTIGNMTDSGITDSGAYLPLDSGGYVSYQWWDKVNYVQSLGYEFLKPKVLYGAVSEASGKGTPMEGWKHTDVDGNTLSPDADGYDDAMIQAEAKDLIWFESMTELEAQGYACVAVMLESRNLANDGVLNADRPTRMNHVHMVVHGRIKDDTQTGQVYAVTQAAYAWKRSDIKDQVALYTNKEADTLEAADYMKYVREAFPSYSKDAAEPMTDAFPLPSHQESWARCTTVGGLNGENGFGSATKASLNEAGVLTGGQGGYYHIDNVYVVKYESQVDIQVAQTVGNQAKSIYYLGSGERVVDFKVIPRMVRAMPQGTLEPVQADEIKVTITLPKGLTYYPNTVKWGAAYTQDSSAQSPGTMTGGEVPQSFVVTENTDGTTTITWTFSHWIEEANQTIVPLYFSCKIGNVGEADDVTNNQELPVTAAITSSLDQGRLIGTRHRNLSATSLRVDKPAALTIIKTAEQTYVDKDGGMGFKMKITNTAGDNYTGCIADILPANGIGQNNYHGNIQVTEFSVTNKTADELTGVQYAYSTDTSYSTITDTRDITNDGTWTQFFLTEDSSDPKKHTWDASAVNQDTPLTAIAFNYTLKTGESIEMHVTLKLPGGDYGDIIHNRLMFDNLISGAKSQIATRSLEGMTWIDSNLNGYQDALEVLDSGMLSGVKVTLLKLKTGCGGGSEADYEPYHYQGNASKPIVTIETGQQVDVLAEDGSQAATYLKGRYRFNNLPEGVFAVRFESGTTDITKYLASPPNVRESYSTTLRAADQEVNAFNGRSDDGGVTQVYIKDISGLPTIEGLKDGSYAAENYVNQEGVPYVAYKVKVPESGCYDIKVGYILGNADDSVKQQHNLLLYNKNTEVTYQVPYSGQDGNGKDLAKMTVMLQAGENILYCFPFEQTFRQNNNVWLDMFYMEVSASKKGVVRMEAEESTIHNYSGRETPADGSTLVSGAYGYVGVDYNVLKTIQNSEIETYLADYTYVAYHVSVPEDGCYPVSVRYLLDGTGYDPDIRSRHLIVLYANGMAYKAQFKADGAVGMSDTTGIATAYIKLKKGTNTVYSIPFEGSYYGIYQGWVNQDYLEVDLQANGEKDSDGIATYESDGLYLQKTTILGIYMPPVSEMTSETYESRYNDSGFVFWSYTLPATGGAGTRLLYIFSGIILIGGTMIYTLLRRRRGEKG